MSQNFDEYAYKYNDLVNDSIKLFGQSHDYFIRAKLPIITECIDKYSSSNSPNVLDVGCGVGLLHKYLPSGIDLHGIDSSSLSIEHASKENLSVTYRFFDGEKIPYSNDSFDLVIMVCVLHHILLEKQKSFLTEVLRVLKKGGALILIEHNPYNPCTRYVFSKCELDRDAEYCYPSATSRLLRSSGFNVKKLRYFLIAPFYFKFSRNLEAFLARIPIGAQYYTVAEKG